ncbi:MAG: pyruvate kinase [Proteobacteria bacterium]|nr:pyruvate kinase [Pseudomonadota bacterium]
MNRRRTKIICTIGPVSANYEMLFALQQAGMDIVRINMSHADHEGAAKVINWIKTLNRKVAHPVPVMMDTQGPEIRTGDMAEPMDLKTGDVVTLSVRDPNEVETSSIHVNYQELVDVVHVGSRITVDNGLINFEVLQRDGKQLVCKVIDGGLLGSKRHVNLPGVRVNLPAITAKDRRDIEFGLANDIDFIALSFVRSPDDVLECRELLGSKRQTVKIIAKIEDQEGVSNIHKIVQAADGVMVARGDLGIETDIADLPNVQRRLVHSCAKWGKRSIVATHLLESMIENPMPTRAEVTDVANAIYEGVDAVMLSGETSVGKFPVRCVEQLNAIANKSERFPGLGYERDLVADTDKQQLAIHAGALAESIKADGIVVVTRRGLTADLVTNVRPFSVPIFAFTNNSQTRRRLALNRAVSAYRTAFSTQPETTLQRAFEVLMKREGLAADAKVVVISDVLAERPTDAIQIRRLGQHLQNTEAPIEDD